MQQIIKIKTPQLKFTAILAIASSIILVLTITPWNLIPTLITEDVTVIAVTEYGCVAESKLGQSVVISDCSVNIGDIISAEFYTPAMKQNGYYDRIEEKLEMINP